MVNRGGRLELDDHQSFTMATAGFFPVPRTNTSDVVGSLIKHLSGTKADVLNINRESGVPEPDQLMHCDYQVTAPFRLDLRTEPVMTGGAQGVLDVYHDLVTDSSDFAHRMAAVPCRIAPALKPVVEAIRRHTNVSALLKEVPSLLPEGQVSTEEIVCSTLEILRIAAMKGFVRIERQPALKAAAAA